MWRGAVSRRQRRAHVKHGPDAETELADRPQKVCGERGELDVCLVGELDACREAGARAEDVGVLGGEGRPHAAADGPAELSRAGEAVSGESWERVVV